MKPVDKIQKIERRMVDIYENHSGRGRAQQAAERIHNLKLQRWHMMRDSFEWTDENVSRIEQMNERMKEALLVMRRRTIEVYESLKAWCTPDKDLHVKGTLWVEEMAAFEGWEQDEDMEAMLFDIMTRKPYCGFYVNSVSMGYDLWYDATHQDADYDTENELLYLGENTDNWNELMNLEKTAHLHLVYGVHNLYEHCQWSLQDLLGILSYRTKIEIEYYNRI